MYSVLLGIVTVVKLEHSENVALPMYFTLSGMSMLTRLLQRAKAEEGMLSIFVDIFICVKFVQPENDDVPIYVTLSGIIISVRLSQFSKAPFPILVTLPGIV